MIVIMAMVQLTYTCIPKNHKNQDVLYFYDISVYNTWTLLLNKENQVDANLDAHNTISGNEPSLEMLTCQSQIQKWAKTGNAKEWRPN